MLFCNIELFTQTMLTRMLSAIPSFGSGLSLTKGQTQVGLSVHADIGKQAVDTTLELSFWISFVSHNGPVY